MRRDEAGDTAADHRDARVAAREGALRCGGKPGQQSRAQRAAEQRASRQPCARRARKGGIGKLVERRRSASPRSRRHPHRQPQIREQSRARHGVPPSTFGDLYSNVKNRSINPGLPLHGDDATTPMSTRLPLAVATLYAELRELAAQDGGSPSPAFNRKIVAGRAYWYQQRWAGARRIQAYLGAETPELLARIEAERQAAPARHADLERRREVGRALRQAMPVPIDRITGRVLQSLADAGVFRAGALVVGSVAFAIYPAMLGRRFSTAIARTGDLDIAAVEIASGDPVAFADAVKAVDPRFFVVPPAPGRRIETSLKLRGGDFRVDLLTPGSRAGVAPRLLPNLGFGAQAVPFLDYLLEGAVEAVAVVDAGVPILVPDPSRYALHKLIVAADRPAAAATKRRKDVAQAEELIQALAEDQPDELRVAAKAITARGGAYVKKLRAGARIAGAATKAELHKFGA
ncbi:MAG: hypothetical protein JNK67_21925 [Alphaproteobacteria bacterium]|nr:hypothetical protein [Alphaproteobacteria bacterium]